MKFELADRQKRLFGGSTLTLVALEDGYLSRPRVDIFDLSGEPKLIYERAAIERGQRIMWRTKASIDCEPGGVLGTETLSYDPGPSNLEWKGTHLL